MLLEPKSRPYTAFTVPGKGQFQWVTITMGLLGAPASFQRLMEKVVQGIQNVWSTSAISFIQGNIRST
jgi:hypothetical protein